MQEDLKWSDRLHLLLNEDKLILWALGNGRVPGDGTRPLPSLEISIRGAITLPPGSTRACHAPRSRDIDLLMSLEHGMTTRI